jgi:uncharacterized protein YcbK (DUF882 family)
VNVKKLAENLQVLRDYLGVSITVNSGYRSPEHTQKLIEQGIRTSLKSYHVKGMASDIVANGFTPKQVFDAIEKLQSEGKMMIGGLHAYNTFLHYDIRGHYARW